MPWMVSPGLSVVLHLLDGLEQLRQAFEREELALQRHQDRMRRRHRVDGDEVERGRAVDQHVGVVGAAASAAVERGERVAQPEGAVALAARSRARSPDRSMVDGTMCSRGTAVSWIASRIVDLADQHVVGRAAAVLAVDAEAGRGVALRIEVDDQHVLADRRERGAEIDRGRGLADAALLVGEGEHARRLAAIGHGGRLARSRRAR